VVKYPEVVGDYLPPPSAEVQNNWSYTSPHPTWIAFREQNLLFLEGQWPFFDSGYEPPISIYYREFLG